MRRIRSLAGLLPLALIALLIPARVDEATAATGPSKPSQEQVDAHKKIEVHTTVTGPNGRTRTRQGTTSKEGNTVTRQKIRTGPYGQSVTTTTTVSGPGAGKVVKRKPRARPRPTPH